MREFLAALDEELLRLPEKLRGPLVLCFLQERTQDEAAKQLGVSLSTLKRRLDTGRELLRVRLSGRGVELSAALAAVGLAVPWSVADAAVRAAVDGVSAGLVSANVLTVTEGVVRAMTYTKLKAWTAGALMVAASAGGTGYFAHTGVAQSDKSGITPVERLDRAGLDLAMAEARAELIQSEADTQKAEDNLRYTQQLIKKGFASPEQERQAELTLSVAKARREAAAKRLKLAELRLAATTPGRATRGRAAGRRLARTPQAAAGEAEARAGDAGAGDAAGPAGAEPVPGRVRVVEAGVRPGAGGRSVAGGPATGGEGPLHPDADASGPGADVRRPARPGHRGAVPAGGRDVGEGGRGPTGDEAGAGGRRRGGAGGSREAAAWSWGR